MVFKNNACNDRMMTMHPLSRMRGIVPDDILDALKKKKLGLPGIDVEVQEDRNAMMMGEFDVIKELLEEFPQQAKIAKAQVFKIRIRCTSRFKVLDLGLLK